MLHDLPSSLTPNWTRSCGGQHSNSHLSRKSVPTRKMETGCCRCYGLILIQRFKTFKRHRKAIKDWSLQRRCQLNPWLSCLDFEHSTPPPLQGKLHWRWCTLRRMPRKAFAGGNKWEWSEWWCRMRGSKNWCRIHEDSSTFELGQKPIYCGLFGILTLLMLMLCWLMLCGWSWLFQVFSWESLNCNCQMLPEKVFFYSQHQLVAEIHWHHESSQSATPARRQLALLRFGALPQRPWGRTVADRWPLGRWISTNACDNADQALNRIIVK